MVLRRIGSLVKLSNKPGPFGLGNKSSSFTALGSIRDEGIWFPVKGSRAKPMALPEGVPLGHGGVIPLVGSGTPQKIMRVVAASNRSLRRNSQALPWNWLVPDLRVAFSTAPADRPNSAL